MRPAPSPAPHVDLTTVFANLAVDRATVEIVRALRTDSIDPILLKGPVVERSLYDRRGERGYCDCDLLVAPGDFSVAERALVRLGFRRYLSTEDVPFKEPLHAVTWRRPGDRAVVDLHRTLMGVGATASNTWEVLLGNTERLRIGDLDVTVPDEPARALIIALHAAQHGLRQNKPHLDLDRALERFTPSVWRRARRLAERLEAGDAMAAGLRLRPAGIPVADRLGLPQTYSAEVTLQAGQMPPMTYGVARVAAAPSLRAKVRLVRAGVAPPAKYMRATSPLARRGRAGLAAAYVWRVTVLAPVRLVPALAAWRQARGSAVRHN